jgi:hypothetical protein
MFQQAHQHPHLHQHIFVAPPLPSPPDNVSEASLNEVQNGAVAGLESWMTYAANSSKPRARDESKTGELEEARKRRRVSL